MYSYIPSTQGHSIVQTSDFILVENTQNCFIYQSKLLFDSCDYSLNKNFKGPQ